MRVTDSQVHVWTEHLSDRPQRMGPNFPVEMLEQHMRLADVDRVVLVPSRGPLYEENAAGASAYSLELGRQFPKKFVVMPLIDLGRPDTAQTLDRLLALPQVRGIRLALKRESEETLGWIATQALRREFPVGMLANRGDVSRLASVVERNPDISLLVDHVALPAQGPDPFADLEQVLALAKYPRVIVKVSGMSRWSKDNYPFQDIHRHIRRIYDAFGPERMAWGSDYTWEVGRIPYREAVDLFREACDFLSDSDREWILDKTIGRVLRWN